MQTNTRGETVLGSQYISINNTKCQHCQLCVIAGKLESRTGGNFSLWLNSNSLSWKKINKTVVISAISNSFDMLTTIHSFSSKQWMTQRQCVYELSHWHNTQDIRTSESHLMIALVHSCLFRCLYKYLCKFHSNQFQLVEQCDYIYQNKFFKCTYVHLCLFHSKLSNIQQKQAWPLVNPEGEPRI